MADNPQLSTNTKEWMLLLMRAAFGGMMLYNHGIDKAKKLFSGAEIEFYNWLGLGAKLSLSLAVFAEVICASLLMLGLLTRIVTIPLIITMLVAILFVHFGDPVQKIELAVLYLVGYLAILVMGGGKYALDQALVKP